MRDPFTEHDTTQSTTHKNSELRLLIDSGQTKVYRTEDLREYENKASSKNHKKTVSSALTCVGFSGVALLFILFAQDLLDVVFILIGTAVALFLTLWMMSDTYHRKLRKDSLQSVRTLYTSKRPDVKLTHAEEVYYKFIEKYTVEESGWRDGSDVTPYLFSLEQLGSLHKRFNEARKYNPTLDKEVEERVNELLKENQEHVLLLERAVSKPTLPVVKDWGVMKLIGTPLGVEDPTRSSQSDFRF